MKSFKQFLAVPALLAGMALAHAAYATPLPTPQVDFRSAAFSGASNQTSFHTTVAGIGMTISGYHFAADGTKSAAPLYWDNVAGIGVATALEKDAQNDEIDKSESLVITFDNTIGLSDIFISKLFAQQHWNGLVYDEQGLYQTDGQAAVAFDAGTLYGTPGDKGLGEAVVSLSKVIPVNEITFTTADHGLALSTYSVLGFTDPPIPAEVPVPATTGLMVMLMGIATLGFARRRKSAAL